MSRPIKLFGVEESCESTYRYAALHRRVEAAGGRALLRGQAIASLALLGCSALPGASLWRWCCARQCFKMDTLKSRAKLSPRPLAPSSQGHTERLPSRLAVKHKTGCRLKAAAHRGNADTIQQDPDSRDGLHAALKTILGAAVIASAGSLFAQPASAYTADASQDNRNWKPRRHHRRLDDRQRTVDLGTRSKAGKA